MCMYRKKASVGGGSWCVCVKREIVNACVESQNCVCGSQLPVDRAFLPVQGSEHRPGPQDLLPPSP